MYCPRCGSLNKDDANYCQQCGSQLPVVTPPVPVKPPERPQYASFWRRFGAYFIDGLILGVPGQIIYWALIISIGILNDPNNDLLIGTISIITSIVLFVGCWLYYALMICSSKQATVGKMALGIIVTDTNGRRLTFARSTARYFAQILSGYTLCIGYLMIIWTRRKQALHDMVVGTVVVRRK